MHLPIIASSLTKITGALENASQNATSVATIRNILNISKLNTNPSMQRRCLTRDGGKFKIILCMWYYLGLFAKILNSPPSPSPCWEIWQIDPNGTTNIILLGNHLCHHSEVLLAYLRDNVGKCRTNIKFPTLSPHTRRMGSPPGCHLPALKRREFY